MSSMLHRIAVFSVRRRALVIGVWLVLLVGLGVASHAAGTKYSSSAEIAGSDSAAANEVMARSFSRELSDASPIVFHTDEGKLTDEKHRPVVEASLQAVSRADNVASVSNPLEKGSTTVSRDGRTAYATGARTTRGSRSSTTASCRPATRRPSVSRRCPRTAPRG